jgi:hypothetical protein
MRSSCVAVVFTLVVVVLALESGPGLHATPMLAVQQSRATAAQTAPLGVLIMVSSDTACVSSIDGKKRTTLLADKPVRLTLTRALHAIQAVSTEDAEDRWDGQLDLTKKDEKHEIHIALARVRKERLEAIEAAKIVAVQDGTKLPVRRIASLQVEEGDWAKGITIQSGSSVLTLNGVTVRSSGQVYARNPVGAEPSVWIPVQSFTIVEVQTAQPQSVTIRSGGRSYPAAFVVKQYLTVKVLVVLPTELMPCTLEFRQ